jgi:hypothetical protein
LRNNKITVSIFLAVLFMMAGLPSTSIAADKAAGKQEVKKEVKQQNNPYTDAKITTRIIPSANKTFGFDVLVNGKTLVHQPSIPAMPGNNGFATKEKARKVADFVVKKIRKNETPPTVTIEDLNKMGVLK